MRYTLAFIDFLNDCILIVGLVSNWFPIPFRSHKTSEGCSDNSLGSADEWNWHADTLSHPTGAAEVNLKNVFEKGDRLLCPKTQGRS